ncbi:MAG TPA: hypothetical protein VGF75_06515, partial [Candidatus Saccharimonadales bacterium]
LQLINDHSNYQTNLSDLSLGKITPPYILAKKHLSKEDYRTLEQYFGKSLLLPKDKQRIKGLLTKGGILESSQALIATHQKECVSRLNKLRVKDQSKVRLLALIDSIKV